MFKQVTLGAAAAVAAVTALPASAEARHRDGYHSSRYQQAYNGRSYYRPYRRCSGTTGTIIGGAGGALLGREIAGRGNRMTGTILGAAAGALLGRQVGKSTCRRSRY